MNAIVLDPATRAHSERFFFLRLRLLVLGILTTVLALYASELGLVGVMGAVFTAIASIWLIGVWRMARLLQVGPSELRAFRPVGWIGVATVVAGAVAAAVRLLVVGGPGWWVIAVCAAAFGLVYAFSLNLSGIVAVSELRSLWNDVRGVFTSAGAALAMMLRRSRPQAPADPSAPAPVDLAAR